MNSELKKPASSWPTMPAKRSNRPNYVANGKSRFLRTKTGVRKAKCRRSEIREGVEVAVSEEENNSSQIRMINFAIHLSDAFTTVSAIESFKAIKENYMPFYSVQELIGMQTRFELNVLL